MSQEDVEVVRTPSEPFNARDDDVYFAFFAEEELEVRPGVTHFQTESAAEPSRARGA
jgi:hypothetical protein